MTWTNPKDDLRILLSDGPTDKPSWKKQCIGNKDGINVYFKTFEFRRVTNLQTSTYPFGVFVNDAQVVVDGDHMESGEFKLHVAPHEGDRVEASYYSQWFTDNELDLFLRMACSSLGLGDSYSGIEQGLRPAALKYASADAYQELSLRFAKMISERYRAEDLPKEQLRTTIDSYAKLSAQIRKDAIQLRDDFYKRQGRAYAPAFGTISGNVKEVKPNR